MESLDLPALVQTLTCALSLASAPKRLHYILKLDLSQCRSHRLGRTGSTFPKKSTLSRHVLARVGLVTSCCWRVNHPVTPVSHPAVCNGPSQSPASGLLVAGLTSEMSTDDIFSADCLRCLTGGGDSNP